MIIEKADIREPVVRQAITEAQCDTMVVDPPYADRVHSKAMSCHSAGAGPTDRDLGFEAADEGLLQAIADIAAGIRAWCAVFSDIESTHLWRGVMPGEYIRTLPWVRWSQPQLSGDRPPSGCEMIGLWHRKGRKVWSGPGSLTAFDERSLRGADKYSCEKPLDLMLSLVSYFSGEGELVVDPCCGAGTTGMACRLLGREAILLDRSADAVSRTRARLDAELSPRDRERAGRWLAYQDAWLSGDAPETKAGAARYARAKADTECVRRALG